MIRKLLVIVDEIVAEPGAGGTEPVRRAAAAAVVANPWAGRGRVDDLQPEVARLAPEVAVALTERLAAALGGAGAIEAFGKAALVGTDGEIEHGAALIHTPWFGDVVRQALDGTSIIVFSDARGPGRDVARRPGLAQDRRRHPLPLPDRGGARARRAAARRAGAGMRRRHRRPAARADRRPHHRHRNRPPGGPPPVKLRKLVTVVEETRTEGGRRVDPVHRVAIVLAVIENPWAGQGFVDDLAPLIDEVAPELGELLAGRTVDALGAPPEAYGKAGIVGSRRRARACLGPDPHAQVRELLPHRRAAPPRCCRRSRRWRRPAPRSTSH